MGAVDIIPGISGGSVAFITGIYPTLLQSLRAIDREAFQLLRQRRFADCWEKINGNFLAIVSTGVLTSVFLLAKLMAYLLHHHSIALWSFFFGLILMASPLMLRKITKWNAQVIISFIAGAVIMYALTRLNTMVTPPTWWLVFLTGAISIAGLLVPGVSGAFILVLIGKYQIMIHTVSKFNIPVLLVFMLGCIVGALGLTRLLSWVMDHYQNTTIALLAGFMLGSLNKVWPWRQVEQFVTFSTGEQMPVAERSVFPWEYITLTGKDPRVFQAILMMALGFFIVILIERISARLKTKN
jgi:putative membrane protein